MKFLALIIGIVLICGEISAQKVNREFAVDCPFQESALNTLSDTPEAWSELSKEAKKRAFQAVRDEDISTATSWLYVHFASEFFNDYAENLPLKFKVLLLKNLTSFMDFYESILPEDNMPKVGAVLEELAEKAPKEFEKYPSTALALALVFDTAPKGNCTDFGLPSSPTTFQLPAEAFYYIASTKSPYDLNKLAICELIWVTGVFGPLEELRSLQKSNIPPSYVERFQTLIRTDRSRIKKRSILPWNPEFVYMPANIFRYGGVPADKSYYAFRFAQANAIPAILYKQKGKSNTTHWVSYMWKPGSWKTDQGKMATLRVAEGIAYNPQTWQLLRNSEVERLSRRGFITGVGVSSRVLTHISKMAYMSGELKLSELSARAAVASDPLNSAAYNALLEIRARRGASTDEINEIWRSKIEAFKNYPKKYIDVLVERRENLESALKKTESEHFFWTNLRSALRADYDYAMQVYSDEIKTMIIDNPDNKEIILPFFADMCRASWVNMKTDPFTLLVTPLVSDLYASKDLVVADKAMAFYESILRRESSIAQSRQLRSNLRKIMRDEDELARKVALEKNIKDSVKVNEVKKKKAKLDAEIEDEVIESMDNATAPNSAGDSDTSGGSAASQQNMFNADSDDALLKSVE